MKTRIRAFALCLALILALGLGSSAFAADAAAPSLSDYFSDRDLSGEWDAAKAVSIALNGDTAACDSPAVSVKGGVVTITAAGTYVLSGSLTNGSVVVNAGDSDKVQLVLAGASVASADSAALLVENADKVFITLAEGTENTLSNGGAFSGEDGVDAVIFARDDITFNGSGSLTVLSPAGHGVVGKDDVKFASGTYVIEASGRGIDANDSARFAGGTFTVTSGKDAVRAKNDEDDSKGYIIVFDGSFTCVAGGGYASGAAHDS